MVFFVIDLLLFFLFTIRLFWLEMFVFQSLFKNSIDSINPEGRSRFASPNVTMHPTPGDL